MVLSKYRRQDGWELCEWNWVAESTESEWAGSSLPSALFPEKVIFFFFGHFGNGWQDQVEPWHVLWLLLSVSDISEIVLEAFDKFVNLMIGELSLETTAKAVRAVQ